ncbi:hypothetical protein BCR42DRAFT_395815 [Absidia repens]|uniref:C3H1-type domain-containing protein n=1 Tax=Absidia repens TaxID=90262 RepID=A0A1X2I658_9FUNG|nr:hypothetical protein BCR42DRAFT_395815 [Absidia repens]
MGVPSDFQYVSNGYIEILLSVIVVSISLAAYYQFSKDISSAQRHKYSSRTSNQNTVLQQDALTTTGHDVPDASKRDITQQYATNIHSNSTLPSGMVGGQGNTISGLHSDISSGAATVDKAEKLVADCQSSKKFTVETGSVGLSDEKSTYMMEAVISNSATFCPLMAHMNEWSEKETTTTTSAEPFITATEPNLQDLGMNQSMNGAPLATVKCTAPRSVDMECLQQLSVHGKLDKDWGVGKIDDQIQEANNDSDDGTTQAKVEVDTSAESSIHQTNNSTNHLELPHLTQTDGKINTNGSLEKLVMEAYNKEKNDKPAISSDYTEPPSLNVSPTYGNTATHRISVKAKTSPSKKTKQHVRADASSFTNTRLDATPLHPPITDNKSKQDMTRLERIDQQRQPYVALYKSRCEFWPGCTNNHCKYYHPFMECRNGNACKFGKKCIFLHSKDYLDHRSLKQVEQAKKKSKTKSNIKKTGDKLHGNQVKTLKKPIE